MATRIKDLNASVQSVAQHLCDSGFKMVDLINAGFLLLKGKTVEEVAQIIRITNNAEEESVQSAEEQFRQRVLQIVKDSRKIPIKKKSARRANPSKSA